MDTVRVDIQKLQMLNDRITQTLEALHQVRASVHGIQHSTMQAGSPHQVPFSGQHVPFGGQQVPFGGQGVGTPMQGQGFQHGGIGHSTPQINPQVAAQLALQQQLAQQQFGQPGPFGPQAFGFGISHSTPQQGMYMQHQVDPYASARALQSFPYAAYSYPPITIY